MKPLIAAAAGGALLAVGGLAAVELGTSDAQAQGGNGLASQVAKNTQAVAANQKRVVADLKRVCAVWNDGGQYTQPAGTKPPPASAPKCNSKTANGMGWPAADLDKDNYYYWCRYYYDGADHYSSYGDCTVTRVGTGMYQVKWPFDITNCVYSAGVSYYKGGEPDKYAYTQVWNDPDPTAAKVYTWKGPGPGAGDPTSKDYPWAVSMNCHPPTKTVG